MNSSNTLAGTPGCGFDQGECEVRLGLDVERVIVIRTCERRQWARINFPVVYTLLDECAVYVGCNLGKCGVCIEVA